MTFLERLNAEDEGYENGMDDGYDEGWSDLKKSVLQFLRRQKKHKKAYKLVINWLKEDVE